MGWLHESFNFRQSVQQKYVDEDRPATLKIAEKAALIPQHVREVGGFPENKALQYEFVVDPKTKETRVVQVREFADRRILANLDGLRNVQQFGVVEGELQLPLIRGEFRNVFHDFEKDRPNHRYILSPERTSNRLALSDQPTKKMRGYAPLRNASLSHQNSRFVQMTLRGVNGFSVLGSTFFMNAEDGDGVGVTQDNRGLQFRKL